MIDIDKLIMEARKERQQQKLKAYQNIKAEIQVASKAKNAVALTEQSQLEIIGKYIKRMEKSISEFLDANRQDLIDEYREELEIIKKLLPEPVSASDIEHHLYNWADELNYYSGEILEDRMGIAIPKKEMGNAIKFLKSKFPTADGKLISEIVKKYIK